MNIQSNFQNVRQIERTERLPDSGSAYAGKSAVGSVANRKEADVSAAALAISQSSTVSDIRMEKVMSVRDALANGSYQVSSSDVAAKLIDHMQSNAV
ncbi:MAG TPA: flagellar biosynthesis anti-sigma factor FlgM [Silvibacterium sp.]|nr:flagellar biosynthesis anti-sigma factor FlgM [Silvibacterium sp.]